MTIRDFASTVKTSNGLDPITISIIVNIVIFILQNCVLNRKDLQWVSPIRKWRLRQICYKADKDNWREIYTELLQRSRSLSEDEIKGLYADLPNHI